MKDESNYEWVKIATYPEVTSEGIAIVILFKRVYK